VDPHASAVTSDLSNLLRIFQKSFFTIGKKRAPSPSAAEGEGEGGTENLWQVRQVRRDCYCVWGPWVALTRNDL
jgi:hypothetical protein